MPITINQGMVNKIAGEDLWEQENISFSINLQEAGHQTDDAEDKFGSPPDFVDISAQDRAAIQEAVELWDDLIDNSITENDVDAAVISINEVTNLPSYSGGITFGTLHDTISGPDNEGVYLKAGIAIGDYNFTAAVHEFGHALGLSHPGDYNAGVNQPTYQNDRMFDEDTQLFSIMSYFDATNYDSAINWLAGDMRTPMIYDILAIQQLYGADTTTRSGDTTYGFHTDLGDFRNAEDQAVFTFTETTTHTDPADATRFLYDPFDVAVFTIWDTGGHDTIDASLFSADQRIDLTPGTYSDIGEKAAPDPDHPGNAKLVTIKQSVGIAFGVTIEDAIGGKGNDSITGNGAANTLSGGGGNDSIDGGGGDDILYGEADGYALPGGDDLLKGGQGNDSLFGGTGNDFLYGESGTDKLDGGAGNDYLDGGSSLDGGGGVSGPDILTGGADNDTFVYSSHYRTTTITDYNPTEDSLDFTNMKSVHSFVDVLAHATQSGSDVLLDFGDPYTPGGIGDTLRLQNITIADLDPGLMRFSEGSGGPGDFTLISRPVSRADTHVGVVQTQPLGGGGFMTFEQYFGDYQSGAPQFAILASVFGADGSLINSFVANTTPLSPINRPDQYDGDWNNFSGVSTEPMSVALANGQVVVVWNTDSDTSSFAAGREIRARVFNPDGTPVGDDFRVNLGSPTDFPGSFINHYFEPNIFELTDLIASGTGGFVVRWVQTYSQNVPSSNDTDYYLEIMERGFDANGTPQTGDIFVAYPQYYGLYHETYLPYYPYPSDVRFLHLQSGSVLSYWEGYDSASIRQIYASIDDGAVIQVSNRQMGSTGGNFENHYSISPSVSQLEDGSIVFTWQDFGIDPNASPYQSPYHLVSQAIIFDSDLQGFTRLGTPGDDVLVGSPYNDHLNGLAGNDTLIGNAGPDVLNGGDGNDTADYSRSLQGVKVNLSVPGAAGVGGHAEGDTYISIENVIGSSYNDYLVAGPGPSDIKGGFGDDQLFGDGEDTLHGDQGNDTLQLITDPAKPYAAQAYGGKGDDTIAIVGNTGSAFGEDGKDTITATGDSDVLNGGAADDQLSVTGSYNSLYGGDGKDELNILAGSYNYAVGDQGEDRFVVDGAGNGNYLSGGIDGDTFIIQGAQSNNTVLGGDGNDLIISRGSGSGNSLYGGLGNDTIRGINNTGTGEYIYGEEGDDRLEGGQGDDYLSGGVGDDTFIGGGGIDTAAFELDLSSYNITYTPEDPAHPDFDPEDPHYGITVALKAGGETDFVSNDVEKLVFGSVSYDAGYFHTLSKAVDGYMVGATVFADHDGDGHLGPLDVATTTDIGGGFTLGAGATGPLVLTGGVDIATGLSFGGKLLAPAGYNTITPLTTLVQLLGGDAVAQQTVLANLTLATGHDIQHFDPISGVLNYNSIDAAFHAVDIEIANTVNLIASAIAGANPGTDVFSYAYDIAFQQLANLVGNGPFDFSNHDTIVALANATLSAGHFALSSSFVDGLATIGAALNNATQSGYSGPTGLAYLEAIAKVAQGSAAAVVKAAADPSAAPSELLAAVTAFTGNQLTTALGQLAGHTGDIDGPFIHNQAYAISDSYETKADTPLIITTAAGVLSNDVNYDDVPLTATLGSSTHYGNVVLNADGSFTYTPHAGYAGPDEFTYSASGSGSPSQTNVMINVDGVRPYVSSIVTTPASGMEHNYDIVSFTLTMSGNVTVVGDPYLYLNSGYLAVYDPNSSGPNTLTFTTQVFEGYQPYPLAVVGNNLNFGLDQEELPVGIFDALTGAAANLDGANLTFPDLIVACYARDTLILTNLGEVPVQELEIGDQVITASGAMRPIKWIGKRSYGGHFLVGQKDILPVCIKAAALDDNTPRRDLWISPHHAMYLEGVLIEARDLINGCSIVQPTDTRRIEYFHIELDSHDVIFAEGAHSETFVNDDSRRMFHNSEEYYALYPNEAAAAAVYCAPRCRDGFEVETARRTIAEQAGCITPDDKTGKLRGHVDLISSTTIEGWAQDETFPDAPICLEIHLNGAFVGQTLANRYRDDLQRARLGSGFHGFSFTSPRCRDFSHGHLLIRRASDGACLMQLEAPRLAG